MKQKKHEIKSPRILLAKTKTKIIETAEKFLLVLLVILKFQ